MNSLSLSRKAAILDPDPSKHVIENVANNNAFYYDASGNQQCCALGSNGHAVR